MEKILKIPKLLKNKIQEGAGSGRIRTGRRQHHWANKHCPVIQDKTNGYHLKILFFERQFFGLGTTNFMLKKQLIS